MITKHIPSSSNSQAYVLLRRNVIPTEKLAQPVSLPPQPAENPPTLQPAPLPSFPHLSPALPNLPTGSFIRCPIDDCCQIFRRPWALNRHMDIIHRRRPSSLRPEQGRDSGRSSRHNPHKCRQCPMTFSSRAELQRHVISRHVGH